MLGPLLYLSALITLTETYTGNQVFNLNTCTITYYQKSYSKIYTNFTEEGFVICFDGFYNPQESQDFIMGPKPRTNLAIYSKELGQSTYESSIWQNVPTISNIMTCFVKFSIVVDGYNVAITISSFGSETALEFDSKTVNLVKCVVKVSGKEVESLFANSQQPSAYTDISGCRIPDGAIKTDDTTFFPSTCTSASCSRTRSLTTTGCRGRCNGNGVCLMTNICTVNGPTIIDIHGRFNSVGDRCVYSLVSHPLVSGFVMMAEFKERRRKDVNCLNNLTMRFINSSTNILLGQNGKVLVNNSLQTLNSTAQKVHGVELSKDQTGVHAKVMLSGCSVFVFFDGNMAQLHIEVPTVSSLNGLCGDSSSFSSSKLSDESSSGCETLYTEPPDSTINCNMMTESCNILQEEPFSFCNTEVDPAPYISACSDTLCKYPAVDGLRCQFLWAYSRACSLGNATLKDWRSEAECSSSEAFCQSKSCSDHEFCGIMNGKPSCLCRAIFTSSYINTLGDPIVCTQNTASVSLVGCLLEEKGIDYSLLHLNDATCKGKMDHETHMVTFSFNMSNSCGAVIMANDTQITFKNTITTLDNSSPIIIRQYPFNIDFSCIILQPGIKTVAFRIKENSVVEHLASGKFNYTVTMTAFTDDKLTKAVDSSTYLILNQKIWLRVAIEGFSSNSIALVIDLCRTTHQKSLNSTLKYDLIRNGCANAADKTVKIVTNGEDTYSLFAFNIFKFAGGYDEVYLHCKINLCIKEGNTCIPKCSSGARKRRSVHPKYGPEASTFVTFAWNN